MVHGDAREGKWRGNCRMECVASTLHTTSGTWCIHCYTYYHHYRRCAHLGCQQSTELRPLADLNGLVRFAERQSLVSARLPSHFKSSLPTLKDSPVFELPPQPSIWASQYTGTVFVNFRQPPNNWKPPPPTPHPPIVSFPVRYSPFRSKYLTDFCQTRDNTPILSNFL